MYKYNITRGKIITKWCDKYLYEIVYLQGAGHSIDSIKELWNASSFNLKCWRDKRPGFREAYRMGRKLGKVQNTQKTKYDANYCKIFLKAMSRGESIISVRAKHNITQRVYFEWLEDIPEFRDAVELGKDKAHAFWENKGLDALNGKTKGFNVRIWELSMRSRFGYNEKTEIINKQKITIEFTEKKALPEKIVSADDVSAEYSEIIEDQSVENLDK